MVINRLTYGTQKIIRALLGNPFGKYIQFLFKYNTV